MKTHFKILVAFLIMNVAIEHIPAQNLVPNFSFEQKSGCPLFGDQINLLTGWSKYSATSTTPDYFNACSTNMGVPQSFYMFQHDHRNCSAYIGLITWDASTLDYKEQVGIQLSQPLVVGQKYFLSFYTVMGGYGGSGDTTWYFDLPSNNIGMRLSTVAYSSSSPAPIDNFAHLRSISVISDTTNWVRISGSIVADSAYSYLMLGNFFDDANTDTVTQFCGNCTNNWSYYFIDDVCVSTDSTLCNGGIDVLPCNVSVDENEIQNQFSFYPNPANEYINIESHSNLPFTVIIYNTLGQEIYKKREIIIDHLHLDISNYNSGLHFITISTNNTQFTYKLLKH